jgi:hypothetical protein
MCVVGLLAATGCPAGDDSMETGNETGPTPTTTSNMEESTAGMDSTGAPSTDLSHATDIQPIWNAHCTTDCHEPGGAWVGFLDMSDSAYDRIVGAPVLTVSGMNHIEPGDLEASYLWHKLQGTQLTVGGNGDKMPYPQPGMEPTVLTPDQLDMIEEWIVGGAPE